MDEYSLRNCDTGRIQPAGEEAILEKVLERGGEGEGDETRIISVISSRGGGAGAASCRTPATAPAGQRCDQIQLQLERGGRCCVVTR